MTKIRRTLRLPHGERPHTMTTHPQCALRPVPMRPRRITWLFLGLFVLTAGLGASYLPIVRRPSVVPTPPACVATAYVIEQFPAAEKLAIPLSCENADRRRAERMANTLANCYAADRQQQWQQSVDAPYRAALAAVDRAQTAAQRAQKRLDAFRRQQAEKPVLPSPATPMVANPRWVELDRQLDERQQQREHLLKTRTPLHPLVLDVDVQIDAIRRQMNDVPRQIPGKKPAVPPQAEPSEQLASLSYALENAQKALELAEQTERQASIERQNAACPQFTILPAETTLSTPAEPSALDAHRLTKTVALPSLMTLLGLLFLWRGAGIDPPLGSAEQVAQTSGVPVVGVLKAEQSIANPLKQSRRQARARRASLALGLLLMVLAPLAVVLL